MGVYLFFSIFHLVYLKKRIIKIIYKSFDTVKPGNFGQKDSFIYGFSAITPSQRELKKQIKETSIVELCMPTKMIYLVFEFGEPIFFLIIGKQRILRYKNYYPR